MVDFKVALETLEKRAKEETHKVLGDVPMSRWNTLQVILDARGMSIKGFILKAIEDAEREYLAEFDTKEEV